MEEHKETPHSPKTGRKKVIVRVVAGCLALAGILGGAFWYVSGKTIYIDQSVISAPLVSLSPKNSGVLEEAFVKEGDMVSMDQPVARVGNEIVKAKTAGIVVSVNKNIGQFINILTGQGSVVQMIDPDDLRVVGHLEETKGLAAIASGDAVSFTVDAFDGKKYKGIVDEVSPTSRASDVVFSISSERPTNEFDVKVRFDPQNYPELKNGMSARIWVYKQ